VIKYTFNSLKFYYLLFVGVGQAALNLCASQQGQVARYDFHARKPMLILMTSGYMIFMPVRLAYQPPVSSTFFQNKSAISNQPTVLFSQNKSASATSQTNMLIVSTFRLIKLLVYRPSAPPPVGTASQCGPDPACSLPAPVGKGQRRHSQLFFFSIFFLLSLLGRSSYSKN
jgi:hypothetical protein